MRYYDLPIYGAKVFQLTHYVDNRGWFSETFRKSWLIDAGITNEFVFDCASFSERVGTIRGLHAQKNPVQQSKLVTTVTGSIQDVIVDARTNSPTYGNWCSVRISSANPVVVYIPEGCYHGFVTLDSNTVVQYKMDNYHSAEHECGISYNDIDLNINWEIQSNITISDRDLNHPSWNNSYKFESLV
jgi:dTDP-4-dehydrorhamnose 3,5-epimerase